MGNQFSSVSQPCPTLCHPMDCSTPGFPVRHQLPELIQTPVHWVSDAIQSSHPLSSPSPAFNLSQHQGLFKWVSFSHQVARVLEFQLQHQSFDEYSGLISFRMDWIWIAILKILGQVMIRTCIWLERSFGSREICWPKLRETLKGHILSSEVLKLCFPQCHKIYVLWYFCLLTYLMGEWETWFPGWSGKEQ